MKKRYLLSLLFILMSIFMAVPVFAAEGKMNVAVLCFTDDAKNSTEKMAKVLANNKLSLWRLNKQVPYYSDNKKRPATHSSVDKILDSAFGSSKDGDINYLFVAAHGYSGINEPGKVKKDNSGFILNSKTNGDEAKAVYKFKDFAKKLTGYKGQFVLIVDSCFSDNFYQYGIMKYPSHASRFTVFCSAAGYEYALGGIGTQFTTASMVKALTYKSNKKIYPADANLDGFITVKELHNAVKGKGLSSFHTYGNSNTQLFQFGYLKLSKSALTLNIADKTTYKLGTSLKKYNCTTGQKPRWKTSNAAVATVDKNGKVTLHKAGTATITAYLADKNGNMCLGSEATCKITVKAPSIKLAKSSITLYKGQKTTLKAAVTGTTKGVSWKTNSKNIATVSKKGKNNAQITAKKAGTATITAYIGKVTATCKVTVKNPTLTLNKTSMTLYKGKSEQLKATVQGASQKVTWKSSNKKIAKVSTSGVVTAVKNGTVTITATANGIKKTCTVTVKEKRTGEIYTVADLKNVANNLSGTYYLMNDLNLGSSVWTPIGTDAAPFTGKFYGNGHTISNLRINTTAGNQGLFGVASGALIQELEVKGSVSGGTYSAGIVGHLINYGKISYCINRASVSGKDQIGGVVGRMGGNSTVDHCLNYGTVTASGRGCGGISADIYRDGKISYCVNMATVSGGSDITGGIVGGCTYGPVSYCYNAGNVTGKSRVGGIAGDNVSYAGSRTSNYFLQTTSVNAGYKVYGSGSGTFSSTSYAGLQSAIAAIKNKF